MLAHPRRTPTPRLATCTAPSSSAPCTGGTFTPCSAAPGRTAQASSRRDRLPAPVPRPLLAERPDGAAYAGDLAADVVRYRKLRTRTLTGDVLTAHDIDAILNLESKLRQQASNDEACGLRTFQRFQCRFEALLVTGDGPSGDRKEQIVTIEDMSAGGVKVRADLPAVPGTAVDLYVRMDASQMVRFPSRIAWVGDGVFGLMFASSPTYEPI